MTNRIGYKTTIYIERSGGGYHATGFDSEGNKRHFGHFDKDDCLAEAIRAIKRELPDLVVWADGSRFDPVVKNFYHCSADSGLNGIGGELASDAAMRLYRMLSKS
jgi:hypothetical protein